MPVNVLYCEGGARSPDVRVLAAVLSGVCLIRPAGAKYGLGERVRAAREATPASVIAGLRDRDLEAEHAEPVGTPREWQVEGGRRGSVTATF